MAPLLLRIGALEERAGPALHEVNIDAVVAGVERQGYTATLSG